MGNNSFKDGVPFGLYTVIIEFGDILIDSEQFELHKAGKLVQVEPLVFDLLVHLVTSPDVLMSRDDLIDHVWGSRVVSAASITSAIANVRKAIGDDGNKQAYIKTVHGRGFKFVGDIKVKDQPQSSGLARYEETQLGPEANDKNVLTHPLAFLRQQPQRILMFLLVMSVFSALLFMHLVNEGDTKDSRVSIAILPFSNIKPDTGSDFLGFALADQIISNLVFVSSLSVRPSSSVRKYDKQAVELASVAEEMGVDYVLYGSYLNEDEAIRLNVELVHVLSSNIVWRHSLDMDYGSVFELQDQVAKLVTQKLNVQFSEQELSFGRRLAPSTPLAYEYYLRSLSYQQNDTDNLIGIGLLEKARELDPNYAPVYAELAYRLSRRAIWVSGDQREFERADQYLAKALELGTHNIGDLSSLVLLYIETGRLKEAHALIQRILSINPSHAPTLFSLGYLYRYAGMLDESIIEMENAIALDPNNSRYRSIVATYHYKENYTRILSKRELDKNSSYELGWQASAYSRTGNTKKALEILEQLLAKNETGVANLLWRTLRAAINKDTDEGLEALAQAEQMETHNLEIAYHIAAFYAVLGEHNKALDLLKNVIDQGYLNYWYMLNDDNMQGLSGDPRFEHLVSVARNKHLIFKQTLNL